MFQIYYPALRQSRAYYSIPPYSVQKHLTLIHEGVRVEKIVYGGMEILTSRSDACDGHDV
jgi:hypothetical protein